MTGSNEGMKIKGVNLDHMMATGLMACNGIVTQYMLESIN